MMLEAAGIDAAEERVYRCLVDGQAQVVASIAERLAMSEDATDAVLARLERKGLVSRTADPVPRFLAIAPDVAVEPFLLQRQQALHDARRSLEDLMERFRDNRWQRDTGELVEVVRGRHAVAQRFEQLQRRASREVLVLTKPPFAIPHEANETEYDVLSRGIRARAIYERSVLETPGGVDVISRFVTAGEEARMLNELPVKFALIDRTEAFVPLTVDSRADDPVFMVVHPSGLLDALLALFELLWERALPLDRLTMRTDPTAMQIDPVDAKLMALLLAGLTDDAVANQLGVSSRTVQRRVHALMRTANVSTRVQLGWHAAALGWLSSSEVTAR
jgi:predicted transcriptional regulator